MIKKILPVLLGISISCATAATNSTKVPSISEIKDIKPTPQQEVSCNRVTSYFTRSHYKEISLDKNFADEVFKMYFDSVDYSHNLFTQSEVDEIKKETAKLLSSLSNCNLTFPFEIYKKVTNRRYEKLVYFLSLLEQPMDFTVDEYLPLEGDKEPFPKDMNELKDLWRKIVKNDFLMMKLSGKDDKKAKELLTKRYNNRLINVTKTKDEDAFSYFENAFARAIDPHTSYLSPEASSNFEDEMNLSMEGIGAVLSQDEDYVKIVSIVPGSPTEKSKKIKPNDRIIGVQQHKAGEKNPLVDVVGMRLLDVVPMVKGPKGSTVTLEIMRGEGANATTFKVDIVRDKIKLEDSAAKGEVKVVNGRKVGVLTVKSFYMNLGKDMNREIQKMKKEGIESLVVDLRNNGGGALSEAINSTGLFIKSGPVVRVRDAIGNVTNHEDRDGVTAYDGPLVVIINRLSASSSEILAAALQDYNRAILVGDTSFGKGTVQQSRPLDRVYDYFPSNLGSIHYTIAKFYRINGGSTQLKGVTPDILFPAILDHEQIGESHEPNALVWDQVPASKYNEASDVKHFVPELLKKHNERASKDEFFKDFVQQLKEYDEEMKNKQISLNFEVRKAEKDKRDAQAIKRANLNLKAEGKAEITNLKDLPDGYEPVDVFLDEATKISLDLADLQKSAG